MARPRLASVLAGVAAAGALGLSALPAASAATARPPRITVLDSTVLAPFQLAVTGRDVLVADGGTSAVSRLRGRTLKPLVPGVPGLEGIGTDPAGDIAYTSSNESTHAASLVVVHRNGKKVVADLAAFEKVHNPDGAVTYGVLHPSACVKKYFKGMHQPATYTGDVNSNPYAVIPFRSGWWLVADAGANAILKVSPAGRVSVAAVLPRQATVITEAIVKANKLPACALGVTYYSNPVPTDLQFGPEQRLYVSLLAGGLSTGSVYTVEVRGHTSRRFATGFVGATNLTVTPRGVVYVTQAFAGLVSRVYRGHTTTVARLANVLSLQWSRGALYAGTAAPGLLQEGRPTGPGSLVRITF